MCKSSETWRKSAKEAVAQIAEKCADASMDYMQGMSKAIEEAVTIEPIEPDPVEESTPHCPDCGRVFRILRPGKWEPTCVCQD